MYNVISFKIQFRESSERFQHQIASKLEFFRFNFLRSCSSLILHGYTVCPNNPHEFLSVGSSWAKYNYFCAPHCTIAKAHRSLKETSKRLGTFLEFPITSHDNANLAWSWYKLFSSSSFLTTMKKRNYGLRKRHASRKNPILNAGMFCRRRVFYFNFQSSEK